MGFVHRKERSRKPCRLQLQEKWFRAGAVADNHDNGPMCYGQFSRIGHDSFRRDHRSITDGPIPIYDGYAALGAAGVNCQDAGG